MLTSYGDLPILKPKKAGLNCSAIHFAADVESAPSNLLMELIELQCSDTLKAKYESVGAAEFPRFIPDTMPHLCSQAAQTLSMFGSTFLCEQLFSLMKINKTSHRTRLTDEHLHSILRISSAQSLTPDIDELVTKIRHQASVSDRACRKCSFFLYLLFLFHLFHN